MDILTPNMMRVIYSHALLADQFRCKVCGVLKSNERGCIVLVTHEGHYEGALWTVCLSLSCVTLATLGQSTGRTPLLKDELISILE